MQEIISADLIFNGETFLPHHAVMIEAGRITSLLPIVSLDDNITIKIHVPILAPAFIDIQIYGSGGKLFSVYPSAETLQLMAEHCSSEGTLLFQPTVATNSKEVMFKSIDAVKEYKLQGGKSVHGLHLEGPWINKSKRGAHAKEFIHAPTTQEVEELLKYGKDVITMITLAPELCSGEMIKLIQGYDVIISAGHSDATFDEAEKSFANGINTVTHLYNAMSPLHHRNTGITAAVLLHDSVMASIVADGHHVNYNMIRLAKKLMQHRLFLITDAVTQTTEGIYKHDFRGDKYEANGILSGSSLSMLGAVRNCVNHVFIKPEEALRMASLYPAKVLGLENKKGRISQGYDADFIYLSADLKSYP